VPIGGLTRRAASQIGLEHVLADTCTLLRSLQLQFDDAMMKRYERRRLRNFRSGFALATAFADSATPLVITALEGSSKFTPKDCNDAFASMLQTCRQAVLSATSLAELPTATALAGVLQRLAPAISAFGDIEVQDLRIPQAGVVADVCLNVCTAGMTSSRSHAIPTDGALTVFWVFSNVRALSSIAHSTERCIQPSFRFLCNHSGGNTDAMTLAGGSETVLPPADLIPRQWITLADAYPATWIMPLDHQLTCSYHQDTAFAAGIDAESKSPQAFAACARFGQSDMTATTTELSSPQMSWALTDSEDFAEFGNCSLMSTMHAAQAAGNTSSELVPWNNRCSSAEYSDPFGGLVGSRLSTPIQTSVSSTLLPLHTGWQHAPVSPDSLAAVDMISASSSRDDHPATAARALSDAIPVASESLQAQALWVTSGSQVARAQAESAVSNAVNQVNLTEVSGSSDWSSSVLLHSDQNHTETGDVVTHAAQTAVPDWELTSFMS